MIWKTHIRDYRSPSAFLEGEIEPVDFKQGILFTFYNSVYPDGIFILIIDASN